jgi:hypothetical protein
METTEKICKSCQAKFHQNKFESKSIKKNFVKVKVFFSAAKTEQSILIFDDTVVKLAC